MRDLTGKHVCSARNATLTSTSIQQLNPFRTAVPFWGQNTQILNKLSPQRDCGPKKDTWYEVMLNVDITIGRGPKLITAVVVRARTKY